MREEGREEEGRCRVTRAGTRKDDGGGQEEPGGWGGGEPEKDSSDESLMSWLLPS